MHGDYAGYALDSGGYLLRLSTSRYGLQDTDVFFDRIIELGRNSELEYNLANLLVFAWEFLSGSLACLHFPSTCGSRRHCSWMSIKEHYL